MKFAWLIPSLFLILFLLPKKPEDYVESVYELPIRNSFVPNPVNLKYEQAGEWIMPPPSGKYLGKWGSKCLRDSDCIYPFQCNGIWCDNGAVIGNR